jgi:hypothetical protein
LGICQTEELVEGGKLLNPIFSTATMNTDVELVSWKILEQLPEYGFA